MKFRFRLKETDILYCKSVFLINPIRSKPSSIGWKGVDGIGLDVPAGWKTDWVVPAVDWVGGPEFWRDISGMFLMIFDAD